MQTFLSFPLSVIFSLKPSSVSSAHKTEYSIVYEVLAESNGHAKGGTNEIIVMLLVQPFINTGMNLKWVLPKNNLWDYRIHSSINTKKDKYNSGCNYVL